MVVSQATEAQRAGSDATPEAAWVTPTPGFCLKTGTDAGEKLFLNICHAKEIPAPPDLSDAELAMVVASGDNSKYHVPVSLHEPHAEVDKGRRDNLHWANGGHKGLGTDAILTKHLLLALLTARSWSRVHRCGCTHQHGTIQSAQRTSWDERVCP